MPLYQCKYVDKEGNTQEILKEAASEDALVLDLSQKNCYPLKIKETKADSGGGGVGTYNAATILEFTETLAMLLSSGLSLKDALEITKTIFMKGAVKNLSEDLNDKINKGDSFHKAISRFRGSFPPLYIGLVRIGEKIGTLDTIFIKLASYLKDNKKLRDKLSNAMAYPITVLGVAILALVGMVLFLFPRIKMLFESMDAGTGDITRSFDRANAFFLVSAIVLSIVGLLILVLFIIRKTDSPLVEQIDRLTLRVPMLGRVVFVQECLNFLFAMETLTANGFSVEDALVEAAEVLGNKAMKSAVTRIREKVIKGEHMSLAFLNESIFEERIGRWISVGERSGKVEGVFGQLRNYYQDSMDRWVTRFMSIIEPVLIVGVGIAILILLLTFFVPIYSIYNNF